MINKPKLISSLIQLLNCEVALLLNYLCPEYLQWLTQALQNLGYPR